MPEILKLSINQKLFVSREDGEWYTTSVQSKDKRGISIGIPYFRSNPLVLFEGDKVRVKFTGEDASYIFETRVTGQVKDRIPLYILDIPERVRRIQQRNFVRVPVSIPVKYAVVKGGQEPDFYDAIATNLSGNGIMLALRNEYKPGMEFLIKFQLDIKGDPENFNLKGRVVRVDVVKQPENKQQVYYTGIEFLDISRQEQDKIVGVVFVKMAKENKWR